ncbi:NUDIX hydrolase [Aeromicrobium sp.]|uniref:NUDIX hydrolase n=1 Tax=Aeromicrobium sp. TaxID=1871063 RepID=UPI003D6A78B4
MRVPVPSSLRDHVAKQKGEPAVAKDAATIALLRDGDSGIEAYLLRRQSTMAFAPGMYVFPGGKVHDSDRLVEAWVGPSPQEWGQRFGCDADIARTLVVAAVRETFEESGILLAGPDADSVVADTSGPDMQTARLSLEEGEYGFADFLAEHGLVLRADLLGAWSHWITPTFEPRRYDTRFFVAALPDGQVVGEVPSEADRAHWAPVERVLEAVEAGEASMLPPTAITCREVSKLAAADILTASAERKIIPIEPRLVEVDGELFLENPLEDV